MVTGEDAVAEMGTSGLEVSWASAVGSIMTGLDRSERDEEEEGFEKTPTRFGIVVRKDQAKPDNGNLRRTPARVSWASLGDIEMPTSWANERASNSAINGWPLGS